MNANLTLFILAIIVGNCPGRQKQFSHVQLISVDWSPVSSFPGLYALIAWQGRQAVNLPGELGGCPLNLSMRNGLKNEAGWAFRSTSPRNCAQKQTNEPKKEVDAPDVSLSNLKSFALFFRASFVLIMAGLAVFLALVHNVIPRWNNELCVTQILICLTTRLFFFSLKLRSKNGLLCCESDCSCSRTRYRTLPYMDIWFWQHVQFFSQIA